MPQIRFQLPDNEIKFFNLDPNNESEYQEQKSEVLKYLGDLYPYKIIEDYQDYKLEVDAILDENNIPCYWCGYIISKNKSFIDNIKTNINIHGSWTYENIDTDVLNTTYTIGFDCAHINDIKFIEGVNSFNNFDSKSLNNCTYKTPKWIMEQLKDAVNSYNN
jgi:hypothetical protein